MKGKVLFFLVAASLVSFAAAAQHVIQPNTNPNAAALTERIAVLEAKEHEREELRKDQLEMLVANLKQATFLVEGMALLLAIFLAWLSVLGFHRFRAAKREIKLINSEVTKKLEQVTVVQNSVLTLEKQLNGDLIYTKKGLESLFSILNEYINSVGNKKVLEMVFIHCNVWNLYSLEEDDRFRGISALMYRGDLSCITHLEAVSLNEHEGARNKRLAVDAIVAIKMRAPASNLQE